MFARSITVFSAVIALAACGERNDSPPAASSAPRAVTAPSLSPAAEAGRAKFGPCAVCHSVREGDNARVGPSLYGVYGRKAGAVDGFAYSKAMRESDIVWTDETLSAYLENPSAYMRGNRMAYPGERNAENRAAIIAYLEALTPAKD